MIQFSDVLTFDSSKKTRDGFMGVRAKVARTGIYDYAAYEVGGAEKGFKPNDVVKVYRPESEVFAVDSVASFHAKPVTNNHPENAVTAKNWKDHACGSIMGAMRDGDYLAFDMVLMDAALIADVENGKRELSNGYTCELEWTSGMTPDGMAYDAIQRGIRGNHIAVVDSGRAGPNCRIADNKTGGGKPFATCDANPLAISAFSIGDKNVTKIMLDGLHVDLSDADAVKAAFDKVKGDADKALADGAKALADANANVATLTAEKAALEKRVSDAEAVDVDKLVADRAALVSKAKALNPKIATDGKSADDIRKEIVFAELGDLAATFDAPQIAAAFAIIAKDAKTEADKVVSVGMDAQFKNAKTTELAAFDKSITDLNAWRNPAKAAA